MSNARRLTWYVGAGLGWLAIEIAVTSGPWWMALPSYSFMLAVTGILLAAFAALLVLVCARLGAPSGVVHAIAAACLGIGVFAVLLTWIPLTPGTAAPALIEHGAKLLALVGAPVAAAYITRTLARGEGESHIGPRPVGGSA